MSRVCFCASHAISYVVWCALREFSKRAKPKFEFENSLGTIFFEQFLFRWFLPIMLCLVNDPRIYQKVHPVHAGYVFHDLIRKNVMENKLTYYIIKKTRNLVRVEFSV